MLKFTFHKTLGAAFFLSAGILNGCVPVEQQVGGTQTGQLPYYADTQLRYEDYIYDNSIRSVEFYAASGLADEIFNPPVLPLAQDQQLVLKFDQVNTGQQRFVVKLVHCDADWKKSALTDVQFLYDFNEFFITTFQVSVNTKVPFYHYRFIVPRVKLSGNYLVVVSDQNGRPLLTRRMLVYESQVGVQMRPTVSSGPARRNSHQQIDFTVTYGQYNVLNPTQEVKVVLRQNYRWDNAKYNLSPTIVHEAQRRLEYTYFDYENNFPGLNEFRVFDTRSLRYTGFNLASIDPATVPVTVMLQKEASRNGMVYSHQPDVNGRFVIDNREYGSGDTDADYATVHFQLHSAGEAPGTVYVFGGITDWKLKDEFRLTYNPETSFYTGSALLKQGYYNYYYVVKPAGRGEADAAYFEGSHFSTENVYDLLVYYRPPGSRTDLLIGYSEISYNERRPLDIFNRRKK